VSRKTEIQVGLTVLVAIAILIWGLAWLKEYSTWRSSRIWHVDFPESGGLAESDEVQVNGMRKGEVKSMKLMGDHVRIDLILRKDVVLTHDCQVRIRNLGLMGEKVVAIELHTTGVPYSTDDVIPGIYEKGMTEIMGEVAGTMESINQLTEKLGVVADQLGKNGKIDSTIVNFNRTSEELRRTVVENRSTIRSTFENFAAASRTAKGLTADREGELRKTLDHVSAAAENMDRLSTRLDSLRLVLQNVGNRLDRGEGTLGKLVQDEKLYKDLNSSVQSLQSLIEDVKAHPKKYFKISVF